jgi:hypothetical protein
VSYIHGLYELKLQKTLLSLVWFDLIFALKKKKSLACNLLLLGGAGIIPPWLHIVVPSSCHKDSFPSNLRPHKKEENIIIILLIVLSITRATTVCKNKGHNKEVLCMMFHGRP